MYNVLICCTCMDFMSKYTGWVSSVWVFTQATNDIIKKWSLLAVLPADGHTFCTLTYVWYLFCIMIIIF